MYQLVVTSTKQLHVCKGKISMIVEHYAVHTKVSTPTKLLLFYRHYFRCVIKAVSNIPQFIFQLIKCTFSIWIFFVWTHTIYVTKPHRILHKCTNWDAPFKTWRELSLAIHLNDSCSTLKSTSFAHGITVFEPIIQAVNIIWLVTEELQENYATSTP